MGSIISIKNNGSTASQINLNLKNINFWLYGSPGVPALFTAAMSSLTLEDPIEPLPAASKLVLKKPSTDAPEASARILILCCTLTSSFSTRLVAVETQNFIKLTSPGRSGSGTPPPLLTTASIFWGGIPLRVISATVRSSRSEVTVVPCDFMRHMSASMAAAFCPLSTHWRKSFLRSLNFGQEMLYRTQG